MTRILIPVPVINGGGVSQGLIELLTTMEVTVLGYHELPDQTSPEQARATYETQAMDALETITHAFRQAGVDADHRLVFTQDRPKTIRRVAEETDAMAVVTAGDRDAIDRLLVSLSGPIATDRILTLVIQLIGERDIDVMLFVAKDVTTEATNRLAEATSRLSDAGIDAQTTVASGTVPAALLDAVSSHDAIVMGEKAPSLKSMIFGEEPQRIASKSGAPVIILRSNAPETTTARSGEL